MSTHHHASAHLPTFEEAVAFHGHRCPGLALGYRAAVLGMTTLGPRRSEDEEIVTVVENDACGVDGVQVVTGCTFGKGNLIFHDYGKHVYTFINRTTGDAVRIVTRADFSTGQIDPQFGDAVSDGLGVSGVTSGQSIDPDEHPGDRATVLESTEPAVECSGLHHLDHVSTVVHI